MIESMLDALARHQDILPTGLSILGLMILSAFFSGSETALTASSRPRMHALEKDGKRQAARVNRLTSEPEKLIGAILFGNNLANIVATSLATSLLVKLYGENGVAIASIVMTAMVLIFAEILPKTYAINNADSCAMAVSAPIAALVRILSPPVRAVQLLVRILLGPGVTRSLGATSSAAMEEIRGTIDLHAEGGRVGTEEQYRLGGVLDLHDLSVGDVMIHRKSIQMIDASLPSGEIIEAVLQSSHTRLPLYLGDKEEIVGILHARDLLRALARAGDGFDGIDIKALARPPAFVPETTPLQGQLDVFLKERNHFSLVVDEYGVLMGLVTLEDILEEIVGEITDEHDIVLKGVRPQSDGSVMADGWVPIRDLNRAMNWNIPDEEAVTLAGLVIHEAQSIPDAGRRFSFHGYRFDILTRQRNQLTLLRVVKQ